MDPEDPTFSSGLTEEQALAIYSAGPKAVVKFLIAFSREIVRLREQVQALEDKIAKNSRNSHKPPSSDGLNKPAPRSLRKRGQRKPGGQFGHSGHTLQSVEKPDHTVVHPVKQCQCCGRSIADQPASGCEKRQIFDLPPSPRLKLPSIKPKSRIAPIAVRKIKPSSLNTSGPASNMALRSRPWRFT